ncbi:c-type cytochrome [candidate division KSB1 bacterium]
MKRRLKKRSYNAVRAQRLTILLILSGLVVTGCVRGNPSERTPIHLNPNMDYQEKYQPQEYSGLFEGSIMRAPVAGTVARNELRENPAYFRGKNADGSPVTELPVPVTMQLLRRGQERFNIYCAPCHARTGDGKGIIVEYEYVPPASFHDQRIRGVEDGHLFDVISNGIRNMPAYAHQVPVADRWAIVSYIRALQRSQNARFADIPEELRDRIR